MYDHPNVPYSERRSLAMFSSAAEQVLELKSVDSREPWAALMRVASNRVPTLTFSLAAPLVSKRSFLSNFQKRGRKIAFPLQKNVLKRN